jgi:hypothetical protein
LEEALEKWSYICNGAVEGPVTKDELKALYEAGKITHLTLVRSTLKGGGWQRYGDITRVRPKRAGMPLPKTVKYLWPLFLFGTPLVIGAIDAFLRQSEGNQFIASNAWLGHAPFALSILAITFWLLLIWRELWKRDPKKAGPREMIIWIAVAPVYQALSWWATALVATAINFSFGFGIPACQADVVIAEVKQKYERTAARKGDDEAAVALTNLKQQWVTDRMRLCTGTLVTGNNEALSVRYRIEDRGRNLFRNTMHGLDVTMAINERAA